MHIRTRKSALLAAAALALTIPAGSALATSAANQTAVDNGIAYMNTQQTSGGSIPGSFGDVSDWAAIAYASAGTDPATVKISGGTSLLDFIKANPPAAGAKATDWERAILAVTAANQDPYTFGGTNYVSSLETFHTGSQIGDATAVNDDIFGVLALTAANVPNDDPALTDALAVLVANQRGDGSFSYSTDPTADSDVDDTASALMALQAAKTAGLTVPASAITNAKTYMLSKQNQDGGFLSDPNWGTSSNVSTSSWALMALNALGDGNGTAGTNAQAYLRGLQQQDGSFPYDPQSLPGDTGDTASAVNALTGGFWPLHIWDGPIPEGNNGGGSVLSSQTGPTNSPSASPSASPSVSPGAPNSGSVLGDSTAAPSASANPAAGKVLGASVLPAAGTAANLLALLVAAFVSLAAATAVYLRTRKTQTAKSDV